MGGKISGGYFNPAVNFMMFLNNKIDLTKFILYSLIQLIAGFIVFVLKKHLNQI